MDAKPPEVWLLVDDGVGDEVGRHVLWLAQALHERHTAVRIVVLGEQGSRLAHLLAVPGLPITVVPNAPRALIAALRQQPPRLLHTHGGRAGLWGRICGCLLHVPVVSTVQTDGAGQKRRRLVGWGDALSLRLARGLIVLGGAPERPLPGAEVIEHVVPLARRPTALAGTVAFVGALSRRNGAQLFCRLANMLPPMDLRVYGDGPLRGELAARCPGLRLMPDPGADGIPWRDVGLLCLTTIADDAFHRALEAMAHGVPVVGFASPSLMRLVRQGENGWLINPGNLAAMARIIDRWDTLGEGARRALSDGARATVAEHFAPRRALTAILSVYARAAARDDFPGQH